MKGTAVKEKNDEAAGPVLKAGFALVSGYFGYMFLRIYLNVSNNPHLANVAHESLAIAAVSVAAFTFLTLSAAKDIFSVKRDRLTPIP